MKKALSLILALMLCMSLSVPAFAADGDSVITEAEAYNRIIALKSEFPEGSNWGMSKLYKHSVAGRFGGDYNGSACGAFAMMVVDRVFPGEFPVYTDRDALTYDMIRVGDILVIGAHAVVVLTKDANAITVVEGNNNPTFYYDGPEWDRCVEYNDDGTVHWGRKITKDKLLGGNWHGIYTCYPVKATGTASRILVNGAEKHAEGYCINGNNYFKLRDLATILSGTSAEFDVVWHDMLKRIELKDRKPYTLVGGECKQSAAEVIAHGNMTELNIDGFGFTSKSYVIGGNNFYKLRDVADWFKTFDVDWDGSTNTIIINTK